MHLKTSLKLQLEEDVGPHDPEVFTHEEANCTQATWRWLDEHPEDAAELADLLNEAAPTLGLSSHWHGRKITPPRSQSDFYRAQTSIKIQCKQRLRSAVPLAIDNIDWTRLSATVTSEMLREVDGEENFNTPLRAQNNPLSYEDKALLPTKTLSGSLVEVNSGGRVLFCLFEIQSPEAMPSIVEHSLTGDTEKAGCVIIKFVPSRLLCQSEQFANELTQHVGISAPTSRIIRAASDDGEWEAVMDAAQRLAILHPELLDEMTHSNSMLVMSYIPGTGLFNSPDAFSSTHLANQTFLDLGRVFGLDMVLGNADRLRCEALGWRGNPENLLFASAGRCVNRLVAIDAVVQRRPPGGLMSAEDDACERLVELALNDAEVARSVLEEAIGWCPAAANALKSQEESPLLIAAFQKGFRDALNASLQLRGLFEMIFDVVTEWIREFIEDIESNTPVGTPLHPSRHIAPAGTSPSAKNVSGSMLNPGTPASISAAVFRSNAFTIRRINQEAAHNRSVGEKVGQWKAIFRSRGLKLRDAVENWQNKCVGANYDANGSNASNTMRLTTEFLDGTHNPLVDVYELKVRLEHMIRRLRVLQQATSTARPTRLLPGVFLSGAVEASSLHLLRQLGITHVINATEDLLLPDETHTFTVLRIPLRDVEEEDIKPYFEPASAFIDRGLASGGGVLIHCHAGRSRSCSLFLAWIMTRRRWTLQRALEFLHRHRPQAAPNAGYLQLLAILETEMFGVATVRVKKIKPEPKKCPVCGDKVGLSAESVRIHVRLKHPGKAHQALKQETENNIPHCS